MHNACLHDGSDGMAGTGRACHVQPAQHSSDFVANLGAWLSYMEHPLPNRLSLAACISCLCLLLCDSGLHPLSHSVRRRRPLAALPPRLGVQCPQPYPQELGVEPALHVGVDDVEAALGEESGQLGGVAVDAVVGPACANTWDDFV